MSRHRNENGNGRNEFADLRNNTSIFTVETWANNSGSSANTSTPTSTSPPAATGPTFSRNATANAKPDDTNNARPNRDRVINGPLRFASSVAQHTSFAGYTTKPLAIYTADGAVVVGEGDAVDGTDLVGENEQERTRTVRQNSLIVKRKVPSALSHSTTIAHSRCPTPITTNNNYSMNKEEAAGDALIRKRRSAIQSRPPARGGEGGEGVSSSGAGAGWRSVVGAEGTTAQETIDAAILAVPWNVRDTSHNRTSGGGGGMAGDGGHASTIRILSSRYLWWKIQFALRFASVAVLPVLVLIAATQTSVAFVSRSFAVTGALLTSTGTFGGDISSFFQFFKSVCLSLPLSTILLAVRAYANPYAWAVTYCLAMLLGAFVCDGQAKKMALMVLNVCLVAQLRAHYDGIGKGTELVFAVRIVAEYTLGAICGVCSSLIPYPKLASRRADRKLKEASANLSLCFSGLCDTFWTSSNMQRRINMVRIHFAQKISIVNLEDANACMNNSRFEPQTLDAYYLRVAKHQLLTNFPPLVDATLRVLEAVSEDPFIIHGSEQALAFGESLGGCLKDLADAVESALFLVANAKSKKELQPPLPSSDVAEENEENAPYGSGRDDGHPNTKKGSGTKSRARRRNNVHPFDAVRAAMRAIEVTYAKARRDLYYTIRLVEASSPPTTGAAAAEGAPPLGGNDAFNATLSNKNAMSNVSFVSADNTAKTEPSSFVLDDSYEMAPGAQEFAALMAFYIFTLTHFASRALSFPQLVDSKRRGKALWRSIVEELWGSLKEVLAELWQVAAYLAPSCIPCFAASVTRAEAHTAAVKMREAIKFSAAMGLSMLFYYYTNRNLAFLVGPSVLCFIASTTSSEALYGSMVRLFGTLFGGVVGFFCARITNTALEKVAACATVIFVCGFFRTGKQYGGAALYSCFVVVPLLAPSVDIEEAIARITQITFATIIYTVITIAVFPTKPLVELANARVQVVAKMTAVLDSIVDVFAAPFVGGGEHSNETKTISGEEEGSDGHHHQHHHYHRHLEEDVAVDLVKGDIASPASPASPAAECESCRRGSLADNAPATLVNSDADDKDDVTDDATDPSEFVLPQRTVSVHPFGVIGASPPTPLAEPRRPASSRKHSKVKSGMQSKDDITTTNDSDEKHHHRKRSAVDEKQRVDQHNNDVAMIPIPPEDGRQEDDAKAKHSAQEVSVTVSRADSSTASPSHPPHHHAHHASSPHTIVTTTMPAVAEDPLITFAAKAMSSLDKLIAHASMWMPLAETEPALTRVDFPATASRDFHRTIMRMRSLLDLMLEALKGMRVGRTRPSLGSNTATTMATRSGAECASSSSSLPASSPSSSSPPSPFFVAIVDDLAPIALRCADRFAIVVNMMIMSLARRHTDLESELVSASLEFEEQCLELHFQKALSFKQLVRLGRIIYEKQMAKLRVMQADAQKKQQQRQSPRKEKKEEKEGGHASSGMPATAKNSKLNSKMNSKLNSKLHHPSNVWDGAGVASLAMDVGVAMDVVSSAALCSVNRAALRRESQKPHHQRRKSQQHSSLSHHHHHYTHSALSSSSLAVATPPLSGRDGHGDHSPSNAPFSGNDDDDEEAEEEEMVVKEDDVSAFPPSLSHDTASRLPPKRRSNLNSNLKAHMDAAQQQQQRDQSQQHQQEEDEGDANRAVTNINIEEDAMYKERLAFLLSFLEQNKGRFPTPVAEWTPEELDAVATHIIDENERLNAAADLASRAGCKHCCCSDDHSHVKNDNNNQHDRHHHHRHHHHRHHGVIVSTPDGLINHIGDEDHSLHHPQHHLHHHHHAYHHNHHHHQHHHRKKLKMLMTNADTEGAHTFTFCLVIFSKEIKRLIMAVEGLQQHMQALE